MDLQIRRWVFVLTISLTWGCGGEEADKSDASEEVASKEDKSLPLHHYPSPGFSSDTVYVFDKKAIYLCTTAEIDWAREHVNQILEHDVLFLPVPNNPSKGLRVISVRQPSIVFNRGLRVGNYLQKVNDVPVSSMDDWFLAELTLIWHCNPVYTNIQWYHYVSESRYNGGEVITIAPDYSPSKGGR